MTPLPFHWPRALPFWAVFFWGLPRLVLLGVRDPHPIEDEAFVTTIGEQYRQFMLGRKRLIPFIY